MTVDFWIICFVLFILFDVYFVWKVLFRKRINFSKQDISNFNKQWKIIEVMDNHSFVIEADKLLHYYLNKLGYAGTIGDILKCHPGLFKNIDALWYAHKLRNKIAHEIGFNLNQSDRKKAMTAFFGSFKDLGL
jgi:hypothetical protein